MERTLVPPTGTPSFLFPMAPPTSLSGLLLLALATARSLAALARTRPCVTVGTGGYVCAPVVLASWLLRIPVILYVPDVVPGKAVRALLPLATRVAVTTEDSLRYLPPDKSVVTGYPLRNAFLHADREESRGRMGIPLDATVLCVFGGSLGARSINEALARVLPALLSRFHVVHVCGKERLAEAQVRAALLSPGQRAHYRLHAFLQEDDMADALAGADLVLARSGASTLGELPATATPGVLVPLPLPGVHQRENAEYLARHGAAILLEDELLAERLGDTLNTLLGDRVRLEEMGRACAALARPRAADDIGRLVLAAMA